MSYNIALFDFPIPNDFEKACEYFEKYEDEDIQELSPSMLHFYQEISYLYPCLCELPDDEIDDSVWCDGPLINNFMTKIPVIGFVYSKVDEALPVVIELANKMGISILDWQQGTVFNAKQ